MGLIHLMNLTVLISLVHLTIKCIHVRDIGGCVGWSGGSGHLLGSLRRMGFMHVGKHSTHHQINPTCGIDVPSAYIRWMHFDYMT